MTQKFHSCRFLSTEVLIFYLSSVLLFVLSEGA